MKKTLIALAALAMASVASAAPYTFTIPTGGNFYAGDYEFDFMVHDIADVSTAGTTLMSYSGTDSGNDYGQNWYKLTLTENRLIKLTVGRGNGTTYQDSATFATAIVVGEHYHVSCVGASGAQTVTLTPYDTTELDTANAEIADPYNGNMNGGDANTKMTVTFNQTFAIPEPATATLSLLALAGLAARRRRK